MSAFRPRQPAVQRLTPNAGNRRFVAGGKGANRKKAAPALTLAQKVALLAVVLSGGGPVDDV